MFFIYLNVYIVFSLLWKKMFNLQKIYIQRTDNSKTKIDL